VRVLGISWLGVAVDDVAPMRAFARETLGLDPDHEREDLVALRFANGDRLELFGPRGPRAPGQFDANAVVAGFLVDDLEQAREELAASEGVELLGNVQTMESGHAWQHFRAPDGRVYELNYDPAR
jgi:catechol 2,3-dioxygenase-like lactoylglutathione lyase family enzyme